MYYGDFGETLSTVFAGPSGGGSGSRTALADNLKSGELVIWRTLWAELDSMGVPSTATNATTRGKFAPDPDGEDDVSFDLRAPDTSHAASELARAFVRLSVVPATYDTRDEFAFVHNFNLSTNIAQSVRDVESKSYFWASHIVGVYEADKNMEFHPEPDQVTQGINPLHVGQSNGPIFIMQEVIRDMADPTTGVAGGKSKETIERRLVTHEILHRFYGPHNDRSTGSDNLTNKGIMKAAFTNITGDDSANVLFRLQLKEVQFGHHDQF